MVAIGVSQNDVPVPTQGVGELLATDGGRPHLLRIGAEHAALARDVVSVPDDLGTADGELVVLVLLVRSAVSKSMSTT